jgi:hypothetical protein
LTTYDIEHWPRLTRFYGLSPFELARLPRAVRRVYIRQLPLLEAEEQLALMHAADFPHLTDEGRGKVHRRLARAAGYEPGNDAPTVAPTQESVAAAGLRINVERESMSSKEVPDA